MTNPASLNAQERNQFMIDKIRADGPAPYQEGRYVLRVMSVPGRRSGKPRQLPIAIPLVAGGSHRILTGVSRMRTRKRHAIQPMLEPMAEQMRELSTRAQMQDPMLALAIDRKSVV